MITVALFRLALLPYLAFDILHKYNASLCGYGMCRNTCILYLYYVAKHLQLQYLHTASFLCPCNVL